MQEINEPVKKIARSSRWTLFLKPGSAAAFILVGLFLIGLTGFNGSGKTWSFLQDNWLMVIFKINLSSQRLPVDLLNQLNLLDIVIMLLFGVLFLALFASLRQISYIWAAIATCLPFLGLILFFITHTAGRSGLLVGGLIFAIIMLKGRVFRKSTAFTGIAASILLFFVGDLGTSLLPASNTIAILIGIGYLLWIIWFFMIGWRLMQLSREKSQ